MLGWLIENLKIDGPVYNLTVQINACLCLPDFKDPPPKEKGNIQRLVHRELNYSHNMFLLFQLILLKCIGSK